MALVFCIAVGLLVFVIGTAAAIVHLWGLAPWQHDMWATEHPKAKKLKRKLSKAEYDALRVKCEGCGVMYHPDWGRYCDYCTGAG